MAEIAAVGRKGPLLRRRPAVAGRTATTVGAAAAAAPPAPDAVGLALVGRRRGVVLAGLAASGPVLGRRAAVRSSACGAAPCGGSPLEGQATVIAAGRASRREAEGAPPFGRPVLAEGHGAAVDVAVRPARRRAGPRPGRTFATVAPLFPAATGVPATTRTATVPGF